MTATRTARHEPARSAFLLRPEAHAWVRAAEKGEAHASVSDVALDALRADYARPARLLVGLASAALLVTSASTAVATIAVLAPYWVGSSGAFFAVVVLLGFAVAGGSAVLLVLLARSGRRLTRAIARWVTVAGAADGEARHDGGGVLWGMDTAARLVFVGVAGIGVVVTVALVFTDGSAENGTVAVPLVVAAILEAVVWIGVFLGLLRVWRAYAQRDRTPSR